MIDKFKDAFKEEATELLGNLEATLLELEHNPKDPECISSVFRTMHTIKGSSAMFGFEDISSFTHEVESIMDLLREGAFIADKKLIDLTLQARDLISAMLEDGSAGLSAAASELIGAFKEHTDKRIREHSEALHKTTEFSGAAKSGKTPGKGGITTSRETTQDRKETAAGSGVDASSGETTDRNPESDTGSDSDAVQAVDEKMEVYRIRFIPSADILLNGTKPLLLLDELAGLGKLRATAQCSSVPPLSQLEAEHCYVGWDMTLHTSKGEDAIRDVFIFVEDSCELEIKKIENAVEDKAVKRLGEILVERGITTEEKLKQLDTRRKRIGEILVEEKIASEEQVKSALDEQNHLKQLKEKQDLSSSSIRVASERLDALVDLVGELVTLQARLAQTSVNSHDAALIAISEQFERLMTQLRDTTMNIRMLPIGSAFSRFRRVVRDLSSELGKEVELVTEGADTELDKTVIEKLTDPLVHIIRNSIDHGIESPEQRIKTGKSTAGTVTLSAMHSGAYVLLKISDDGAGLNRDRIYEKAVERGLIAQGSTFSDQDLYQLIFAPGFSTASKVTSVSGRGVGMDVVKRQIDALGGLVSIQSESGQGTCITLKIPLTLAIIEGLLVRTAKEYYVIPLSVVDGCLEIKQEEKKKSDSGRNMLTYRNEILPFVSVRELFEVEGTAPDIEQIVVVNALDSRIGFVVDQVIGDNQTVIKPLGRMFKTSDGLSGATILGDGNIALIIDVNRLAVSAQREEQRQIHQDKHERH